MEEQGVFVVGASRRAVEFVVVGVLQTDACIEPRPTRRLADTERDVGDFGREAVAVRGGDPVSESRIQEGIRTAPDGRSCGREGAGLC